MFARKTVYTVAPDVYLNEIMTSIPSNAFINKGRCGIGGTTLEINNHDRCSIIVAPTIGILKDKKKSHPELFIVNGDVGPEIVKEQLNLRLPHQKIMTTPEGMKKIMDAAKRLKIEDEVIGKWFLMLDECHTFISEHYRKYILLPFKYFWQFSNKAIISATPYVFTDPRCKTLDYYKITFTSKLGTVKLIESRSAQATLDQYIKEGLLKPGNMHIFLNSVTETVKAARRARITDFNIFCADDKDKKNMEKLGDLQLHYVEQPDKDNFKKVNFYTCRYFEGWDMHDDNATIILVTDVHNTHTKVSVGMKLKQAAGRLRKSIDEKNLPIVYHITNHNRINLQPKSLESFKAEYYAEAEYLLEDWKKYLAHCKEKGQKPEEDSRLEKYVDFQCKTKVATIDPYKVDQQVDQAYNEEMYNHIELIRSQWEEAYFNVEISKSNIILETKTTMNRKSKSTQLKEDYQAIIDHRNSTAEIDYSFGRSIEEKVSQSNPLAYEAAKYLNKATMERLKYNVKKVEAELILGSNKRKEVKLLQLLGQEFKVGNSYTNEHITSVLKYIYERLDLKEPETGEIVKAKATHLGVKGWFDVGTCKLKDKDGKYTVHGYTIIRLHFNLRTAA